MALAAVALANARKNTKEVAANKILFHAAAAAAAATAAATAAEPLTAGLTAAPEATEHTTTPTVRQPWLPLSCSRHSCLQACCGGCALGSVIGWFGEGVRDGLLLVVRACAVVLVAPRARCLPCFGQRLPAGGRVRIADSVWVHTKFNCCVCLLVDADFSALRFVDGFVRRVRRVRRQLLMPSTNTLFCAPSESVAMEAVGAVYLAH